ncbi:hypothetical protein ACLOJK_014071 [Asimina triloba]
MGCGGSKVDDLPLVNLCRERKELIRDAADRRYALAAAHVAYFRALSGIGHALHRFVNEELSVLPSSSPSSPSSPVLTLPPSKGKSSSSSTSISHSVSQHDSPHDSHDSHLQLHSHSDSEDSHLHFDSGSSPEHSEEDAGSGPSSPPYQPPTTNYYYMRSSTAIPAVVYEQPEPQPQPQPQPQPPDPAYGWSAGYFGYPPMGPGVYDPPYYNAPRSPERAPMPPPPPPPPEGSAWDFLNPFGSFENGYPGYGYGNPPVRYGSSSSISSPDSAQVREREGIPDLEDETDQEPIKPAVKKMKNEKKLAEDSGSGPGEGTPKTEPEAMADNRTANLASEKEIRSSPGSRGSRSIADEGSARKKGVTFEAEPQAAGESTGLPSMSSTTSLSTPHIARDIREGTRDIQDVVNEIKDQFETAVGFGKEVSMMLEAGKLQYRRRNPFWEVISCRMFDVVVPSAVKSSESLTKRSKQTANISKMAKFQYGGVEKTMAMKSGSLSATLEKLYAWEKKLYKEVKSSFEGLYSLGCASFGADEKAKIHLASALVFVMDEEKLRIIYEKQCKRLKILDDRGAESNKIDATEASIRKLLTKMSIAIKAVDAISSRIHKLRDEELQPQMTELIQGLITMWRNMVKCHQKQFQAILEAKSQSLKGKIGIRRDSSMRATMELEAELLNWCSRFNDWINTQKAYIEALNEWLLRCLLQEPEETPDGIVPFSPGRVGAPPVFVVCNDWNQAMERISEAEVARAIQTFAGRVHTLWEMQDEEQRQKLKADDLSKDLEKRIKSLRREGGIPGHQNASDRTAVSVSGKDTVVLPDDDSKLTVDSMRKRLDEEKAKHAETVKQVHEVASGSLEMGLVPIFEAMENFTCEMLKVHEEVRIQGVTGT